MPLYAQVRSAPGSPESRRLTVFSARVPAGLQEGSSHTRADGQRCIRQGLDIDIITVYLDFGRAWYTISSSSAEAERTFSCLSRLRFKFRGNLHIHREACVRSPKRRLCVPALPMKSFLTRQYSYGTQPRP